MAIGVVAAVEKMASSFEKAYYASQRSGSSVREMNRFSYAASQLGSSVDEAQAAIQGLAQAQKEMPGFASILKGLGATDPKNLTKSLDEIIPRLAAMSGAQAEAYAKLLHIPPNLLHAMQQADEFRKLEEQSDKKYSILGFNPQKAAEDGRALTRLFRDLADTVTKITDAIGSKLFNDLKGPIADLNQYLLQHGKELSNTIAAIGEALFKMLDYIVRNFPVLDKFVGTVGGWSTALTALGVAVSAGMVLRVTSLLGAMRGLTMLAMPPWVLALLGIGAGAMAGEAWLRNQAVGTPQGDAEEPSYNDSKKADPDGPILGPMKRWWKRNAPGYLGGGGGGRGAPIGKLAQNGNAQAVIEEMRKAGYNDNAIAAVVGSMQTESSFNPRAHNDANGGHTGAWQWDSTRWPKIKAWIESQKGDPYDYRWQAKAWIAEHNAKPGDAIYDTQKTEAGGAILRSNPSLAAAIHGVALSERFGAGEEGGRAANAAGWLPHLGPLVKTAPMVKDGDADWRAHRGGKVPIPKIINPFGGVGLNPDKLRSQMGGGQPLGGGAPADNSKSVIINQNNHNHVTGVSDPTAAAAQIGARQDRHSSTLVRNMQSAIG